MAWLVVAAALAMTALQIWRDTRQYPRFKAMTQTADRQRMLRYWVADAFFRYGALGVFALFLLGRQDALAALPAEIAAARDALAARFGWSPPDVKSVGVIGTFSLAGAMAIGAALPFVLRPKDTDLTALGDVMPLIPRNRQELPLGIVFSLNAGVSEEIFFRMAAPFAFYSLSGNLLIAFGAAAVLFGLAHAYQGVVGALATTLVGLVMTLLYLASGQIWLVIALHAVIDLRAMVFLPLALRR